MRFGPNSTINLTLKECVGYACAALTTLSICVGLIWNIFVYTGEKYDNLIARQDRLHKETRELTQKAIEDEVAELGTAIGLQVDNLGTIINKTHTILLEKDEIVRQQIQQTTKNEIELKNVIQDLERDSDETEALEIRVDSLSREVASLKFAYQGGLNPSSIQPGAPPPSTVIRPALKPRP